MTFEIVFRKTFRTDDADPICTQSDDRVIEWFVNDGAEVSDQLWGLGFVAEITRKP